MLDHGILFITLFVLNKYFLYIQKIIYIIAIIVQGEDIVQREGMYKDIHIFFLKDINTTMDFE